MRQWDAVTLNQNCPNSDLWWEAIESVMRHTMNHDTFQCPMVTMAPTCILFLMSNMMGDTEQDSLQMAISSTCQLTVCTLELELHHSEIFECLSFFLRSTINDGLKPCGANISCAHLEANNQKKVSIMAGPEFGEAEGQQLLIHKALCGLWILGQRWHK